MQQRLYHQTADGWFVYREEKSCALYADFASKTMIRLSYRADENRIYFSAFNAGWSLHDLMGTLTVYLFFPEFKHGHGSAGMKVANVDGRHGYTANSFGKEFLDHFSASSAMVLSIVEEAGDTQEIESFEISGSGNAVRMLRSCHANFFDLIFGEP